MFDVARGNQEDSIVGVFQTDSGVANMGWFGPNMDMLWCASMTRGLTIWNSTTGERSLEVHDYWPIHNDKGVEIDYVVGCFTSTLDGNLYVLCGDQDGSGFILPSNQPDQIVGQWKGHQVSLWFMFYCSRLFDV